MAAIALSTFGSRVEATPIAYEGFSYPDTTRAGTTAANSTLTGGSGWSGGWFSTTAKTADVVNVASPGLTYTGVPGNGLAFNSAGGNSATAANNGGAQTLRMLSVAVGLTDPAATLWLSFIGVSNQGSSNRYFNLSLYNNGTTTDLLDIGHPSTTNALAQYNWGLSTTTAGAGTAVAYVSDGSTPTTTQSFLLLRITNSTASLWINPTISNGEAGLGTANATTPFTATSITAVRMGAGQLAGGLAANGGLFDEINLGTTFADVTTTPAAVPEPLSTTFLVAGGVGLVLARRRGRFL